MTQFGKFLQRKTRDMTLVSLSRKSGVNSVQISRYRSGKDLPSNIQHVIQVMESLDLTEEDFVYGMKCVAYDLNYFRIPVFRGTNAIGMDTIVKWSSEYYRGINQNSEVE